MIINLQFDFFFFFAEYQILVSTAFWISQHEILAITTKSVVLKWNPSSFFLESASHYVLVPLYLGLGLWYISFDLSLSFIFPLDYLLSPIYSSSVCIY